MCAGNLFVYLKVENVSQCHTLTEKNLLGRLDIDHFLVQKWKFGITTYALIVISNKIAAIGMMNNPSQNTGDVNNSVCIPVNTAAIGIDGQKLLQVQEEKHVVVNICVDSKWNSATAPKINLPINYDEYEPHKNWSPNRKVCEPSPVVCN